MSYDGVSAPSWGLVLVRLTAGSILMAAGWGKLGAGVDPGLVLGTRAAFMDAPGIVRAFGEHVVLPHPSFFAYMIAWGELLGGIALFLGALTRPAGWFAFFMLANFYFVGPESARSLSLLLGICCLACALSRAGVRAGADVFLDERLPGWMTWTRGG